MTRIVGGVAGGRRLTMPPGRATRPTSERVREGLFSALESTYGSLTGLAFLDLFAGSGAVGIEAASRGAARVTLVERDARAVTVLRANVGATGLAGVDVQPVDVARFLTGAPTAYDVVFLDPPYADPVASVLTALVDDGWLTDDATVVVERATRDAVLEWPAGLVADRTRRYGDTTLWYGRRP